MEEVVEGVLGEDAALEAGGKAALLIGFIVLEPFAGVQIFAEGFVVLFEVLALCQCSLQSTHGALQTLKPLLHLLNPVYSLLIHCF